MESTLKEGRLQCVQRVPTLSGTGTMYKIKSSPRAKARYGGSTCTSRLPLATERGFSNQRTCVRGYVSMSTSRQVVGRGRFREGTGVECLGSLRALRRVTGRGVIPGYKVYLRLLMNRPSGVYSPLFTCLWGTVARRLVANEPPPVPRGGSTPSDGRPPR